MSRANPALVGFDCETYLIRRGSLAPPLVCLTLTAPPGVPHRAGDNPPGYLVAEEHACAAFLGLLCRDEIDLVGHNAVYDLGVLCAHAQRTLSSGDAAAFVRAVFEAVAAGRVICTQIRERLIRIAFGELDFSLQPGPTGPALRKTSFDLASLVERYHNVALGGKSAGADGDPWRFRYAELDDVPLHAWPDDAVAYAIGDAYWAREVAAAQLALYPATLGPYATRASDGRVLGERREVAAAWALHLAATWGVRTDGARVAATLIDWRQRAERGRAVGLVRGWVRPNGTRSVKALQAAVVEAVGDAAAPRTAPSATYPAGQVKTDEATLTACGGDLAVFATSLSWDLVTSRWGGVLPLGAVRPITSRPEVLRDTGRTAWSDPAWQQPPRDGGVRECVVPRPGWVLCSVDYDVAELCALAQVCRWAGLGSRLGDALNAGQDVHTLVGGELLDLPYEEAAARRLAGDDAMVEARQIAKALDFGLPGGLQAEGFRAYAAAMGIVLTPARAAELHAWWHRQFPEVDAYFRWVRDLLGPDEVVQHPVSLRLRGGVRYTAALNGYFQGLVADGGKYALTIVSACGYGAPHPDLVRGELPGISASRGRELASTLAGNIRPVLFLHDEILSEIRASGASAVAEAKAEIMRAAMRRHTPDQISRAAPTLMARWSKRAKQLRDPFGELLVWNEPKQNEGG